MLDTTQLSPGQVVKSLSGRDKGFVFFILSIVDEQFVLLSDGDVRKVEKPKKKKVKHLQIYNLINENISRKLKSGLMPENFELRRELEKSGVVEKSLEDVQI